MPTSEEIQAALKTVAGVRELGGEQQSGVSGAAIVLADTLREYHERLWEAAEELTYVLPTDNSPIEIQERIDTTLAKLTEEYR